MYFHGLSVKTVRLCSKNSAKKRPVSIVGNSIDRGHTPSWNISLESWGFPLSDESGLVLAETTLFLVSLIEINASMTPKRHPGRN